VRSIEKISHHVGDFLHLFADRLQSKDVAQFRKYDFDDLAAAKAG
jgi:hypothetical protein